MEKYLQGESTFSELADLIEATDNVDRLINEMLFLLLILFKCFLESRNKKLLRLAN